MSSIAGSSRHILHARLALEDEIKRIGYYLHYMRNTTNINEKLFYMKAFFEYLRIHTIRISQHVGFRLFVLEQIKNVKKMGWEYRYASHAHMKSLLNAMRDVEKNIRDMPIKGAF